MKKESMRKYSILGLVLVGASAVTAAVLPKNEPRKFAAGNVAPSAGVAGSGIQQSCVAGSGDACTYTVTLANGDEDNWGIGSRSSADGVTTSTFTNANGQNGLKTDTAGNKNSSISPN